MKSDISNIDINIDEDIKKDIKDFYFSKKDLENIKIPLDLDDIIDEPFKEEKKENIVNICQHTNSPFIVSVTKINPMYKRKLIKKDNRRYLL